MKWRVCLKVRIYLADTGDAQKAENAFSEKKVSDCAVDLSDIMGMNTSVIAG